MIGQNSNAFGSPIIRGGGDEQGQYLFKDGVYLYARPVTKILFLFLPALSVPIIILLTLVISYLLGCMSWVIVEKPVMSLVRAKNTFPVSVRDSHTVPK